MRKGYVTLYFTIVFSLVLSMLIGMIYSVRANGMRMRGKQVIEIAMESAFAEYQKDIWDYYNLIFIDSGYSMGTPSLLNVEDHLIECMNNNFNEQLYYLPGSRDLYRLSCVDAITTKVRFASDDVGAAVNEQAIKYMGYKYKVSFIVDLYKMVFEYEDVGTTSSEIRKACEESQEKIKDLALSDITIREITDTVDDAFSIEDDYSNHRMLELLGIDISNISTVSLDESQLLSKRGINSGNYLDYYSMNFADSLVFREYAIEKCNNYLENDSGKVYSYETEYLISGKGNDADNLETTLCKLLLLREGLNLAYLLTDQEKINFLKTISETISLLLLSPEIAEPLTLLLATIWSYKESLQDVNDLLEGKKVGLFKSKSTWKTEYNSSIYPNRNVNTSNDSGLTYKDYLRILLCMTDEETVTSRLLNIIEVNVRKWIGSNAFRLDYCIDEWQVTAFIISDYGYEFTAERAK